MAKKVFYIQKVKPVEEVEVKVDGSDAIVVGFKVHGLKARKEISEKYEGNRVEYIKLVGELQSFENISKAKEAAGEVLSEEDSAKVQSLVEKASKEIEKLEAIGIELVKNDVVFFKNVVATDYDELGNNVFEQTIADTRLVEASDYWDTPAECLENFINAFLDNKQWLEALKQAHTDVLQKDFKEAQAKN